MKTMHSSLFLLWCCFILFSFNFEVLTEARVNKTEIDRESLLCFKSGISSDPLGILNPWLNTSFNFCSWPGVTCGTERPTRVVSLGLSSSHLTGVISGCIADLTSIWLINLADNRLTRAIPKELGRLLQLQTLKLAGNHLEGNIPDSFGTSSAISHVNLANNSLTGGIPYSLASSSSLRTLILSRNNLSGGIPAALFANSSKLAMVDIQMNYFTGVIPPFGNLPSLKYLCVTDNLLSGSIPPAMGNVSSLNSVLLGQNGLTGSIPESLSLIPKLLELDLSFNSLAGHVPLSLYNISSLKYFNLGSNDLVGQLPPDIGNSLPNLEYLIMQSNNLDGIIPISLSSGSKLLMLDLSANHLHGHIPSLGSLENLRQVLLGRNLLETQDWAFLDSLTNCTQLTKLSLEGNLLKGNLPRSVCNLTTSLELLALGSNQISGSIPTEISNLVNLTLLGMENNLISGSIPPAIGILQNLFILDLSKNNILSQIPSSIGNITELGKLFLGDNNLSGNIPSSLGQCFGLLQLNLSSNRLDGFLPKQLFAGPPFPLGIDLSHNKLIGQIPVEIDSFMSIILINVSNNLFSGEIPVTLCTSWSIKYIDLSRNNLSGHVMECFANMQMLEQLDLSYNNLRGEIPTDGCFQNSTVVSLDGNVGLCSWSSTLGLPICHEIPAKRNRHEIPAKRNRMTLVLVVVPTLTAAIVLFSFYFFTRWRTMEMHTSALISMIGNLFCFVTHWGRRREHTFPCYGVILKKVSHVDIAKATNWFAPSHRISSSRTGSVYFGRFKFDSDLAAIKVFNLNEQGAHESYFRECEAQQSMRHRNILKLVTLCSTLDRQNNEFKALIFPFMVNGSLERWLHPKKQCDKPKRTLSLGQRICIIADVASALDYLHNLVVPPLVHCDLKPSNILLDYDMTAQVGDFGSAKFFLPSLSSLQEQSISVRGTIGYLAPEYGMGRGVSTKGDVYSFGVILLEMFTGKQPMDEMFVDGLNLHNYTCSMLPARVAELLDPHIAHEEDQHPKESWMKSYIIPLVELGLSCSMESAKDRPGMQDVCAILCGIKEAYLESRG